MNTSRKAKQFTAEKCRERLTSYLGMLIPSALKHSCSQMVHLQYNAWYSMNFICLGRQSCTKWFQYANRGLTDYSQERLNIWIVAYLFISVISLRRLWVGPLMKNYYYFCLKYVLALYLYLSKLNHFSPNADWYLKLRDKWAHFGN